MKEKLMIWIAGSGYKNVNKGIQYYIIIIIIVYYNNLIFLYKSLGGRNKIKWLSPLIYQGLNN